MKGERFDGVNTCYAFLAMENLGGKPQGRENDEHEDTDPAVGELRKAILKAITPKSEEKA